MSFITYEFWIFFLVVLLVYFLLRHKQQNIFLLVASYVFYGCWDWRLSFLLIIPTVTDYFCGSMIEKCKEYKEKGRYLTLSLMVNLSVLLFFKSFNFFIKEFNLLLAGLGLNAYSLHLNIILPIGISFYIFKSLSYTIDIYRRQLKPVSSFLDYALFVSFFPSLLAGPIERAANFLPQILNKRTITWGDIRIGLYLIYWGAFKKIFIADNLAPIVQAALYSPQDYTGSEILVVLYAAAFRLYCDISGYTDIARGVAKCMGFNLSINFNLPYFSKNISEYWRKWHMSMTYWFRDYVYFPLFAFTKGDAYFSSFVTLLCISLWHSISLSSIWRGIYYGLAVCIYQLYKRRTIAIGVKSSNKITRAIIGFLSLVITFHIVCIGGLFFYEIGVPDIVKLISKIIFSFNAEYSHLGIMQLSVYIWILLFVELLQAMRKDEFIILKINIFLRLAMFWFMFWGIFGGSGGLSKPFVYFGF